MIKSFALAFGGFFLFTSIAMFAALYAVNSSLSTNHLNTAQLMGAAK